ncbi:ABC-F family ATP-binding cassette domain-containing protein [Cellulomonas fimi]|uniref:ABC transporter related protein n=1 Tax=Cellulomonas fimi (strain ATCC 484 / DSM 20113 / JCM 1341 / CCUG 24087 / LMG 16345 / NBRC 15513 / NCIMB 8980 / NCTC 7547 / NRS-133) TaxID=590998 RepID=F4H4M4_CELFA|nr:ABC-F family ATP-binding cassette domain-containing protein [Cellulomonas fimi]AEE47819.1 ABC transporter related protein [Cellulomonas fimi ATCC 484]NNH06043.1 ABC-F family ATP-binding cassette domain-containing protein [Cellulomonas fimi]
MTPVLRARSLTRSYDGRPVLSGLDLDVDPGHRLGVVGENGIGKSTLLRLLAGVEDPDSGSVERPAALQLLAQEPTFRPADTVADVMAAALADVRAVERVLEDASAALADDRPGAADAYAEALLRAELAGVWDADRRAELALVGLGLGDVEPTRPTARLSGGERSRLALAALLVRSPAAVLLDEPTNHLDDAAAEYLAGALRELPGAVVLTSHDRVFLDETCTGILDLDPSLDGPTRYGGTFTDYLAARRAERQRWEERWRAERDELARLRHAVRVTARQVGYGRALGNEFKMAYDAKGARVEQQVSRRVRDARRRLDELTRDQVPRPPAPLRFAVPDGWSSADGVVLRVRDAVVPGRLEVPSFDLLAGAQVLVSGPNGAGKSTLLHLLAGDLVAAHGSVQRAGGAEVALLEQDVGLADDVRTPRALFDAVTADVPAPVRLVDLGLVAPRDVDRPLRELSVGQRRRVVLALLVARTPAVLLLDEPTNHVSVRLADELVDALEVSPGAVVVATHDRWLRRRWTGERLHVADGRVLQ